jgi:hypothetical protein
MVFVWKGGGVVFIWTYGIPLMLTVLQLRCVPWPQAVKQTFLLAGTVNAAVAQADKQFPSWVAPVVPANG